MDLREGLPDDSLCLEYDAGGITPLVLLPLVAHTRDNAEVMRGI